jgi:hypothetical protein
MDSLLLLYRPNVNEPWQIHPDYYKRKDFKSCVFRFSMLPGDYAFGRSIKASKVPEPVARAFDKPITYQFFDKRIQVSLIATARTNACLELYHVSSKRVEQQCVLLHTKPKKFDIPTSGLEPGLYFIKLRSVDGRLLQSQKIYISNN